MREWYESLASREQLMLGAGLIFGALLLYFLIVWEPLSSSSKSLQSDLEGARELVSFMQVTHQQSKQYASAPSAASSGRSLLAQVDSSSKSSGLGDSIKRIQPDGQTSVRLWLENVPFEKLTNWLNQLQTREGIVLSDGNLDRDAVSGTVKARLTLVRNNS